MLPIIYVKFNKSTNDYSISSGLKLVIYITYSSPYEYKLKKFGLANNKLNLPLPNLSVFGAYYSCLIVSKKRF